VAKHSNLHREGGGKIWLSPEKNKIDFDHLKYDATRGYKATINRDIMRIKPSIEPT
jgi:hypothetical protein